MSTLKCECCGGPHKVSKCVIDKPGLLPGFDFFNKQCKCCRQRGHLITGCWLLKAWVESGGEQMELARNQCWACYRHGHQANHCTDAVWAPRFEYFKRAVAGGALGSSQRGRTGFWFEEHDQGGLVISKYKRQMAPQESADLADANEMDLLTQQMGSMHL